MCSSDLYLMALLDMQREAGDADPSQASLARHLGVSAPTALEMLRRLRALGLVDEERVRLTPGGTSAALVVLQMADGLSPLFHRDETVEDGP